MQTAAHRSNAPEGGSILKSRHLPLFRQQAIDARNRPAETPVIHLKTPGASIAAWGALVVTALLASSLIWGRLTRTVSVPGLVMPVAGIVKVYSEQSGIIIKKLHNNGDVVKSGDPLLMISGEVNDLQARELLARGAEMMRKQIQELSTNLNLRRRETEIELAMNQQKLADLSNHLAAVEARIKTLTDSVGRDAALLTGKQELRNAKFLTIDALDRAQATLAADQEQLFSSVAERHTDLQSMHDLQSKTTLLPIDLALEESRLTVQIFALEVQLAHNEMRRLFAVTARTDGVVSDDVTTIGETVGVHQPLMVIAPAQQELEVQLLVPTASSGFLQIGSEVAIRYAAFPYQKFGFFRGRVRQIFDIALTSEEIDVLKVPVSKQQPMYRVLVTVDNQAIPAYGTTRPLRPGMLLTADVAQETRYLYEWMLEPVLSVRGYVLEPPHS